MTPGKYAVINEGEITIAIYVLQKPALCFYIARLSLLNSSSYYQHFYPHLLLTLCKFQFCFFIYSTITENLVAPLQEKMEEWKRNVAQMDKDHAKGIKLFFFFINTCCILFCLYSLFNDIPLFYSFGAGHQTVSEETAHSLQCR